MGAEHKEPLGHLSLWDTAREGALSLLCLSRPFSVCAKPLVPPSSVPAPPATQPGRPKAWGIPQVTRLDPGR